MTQTTVPAQHRADREMVIARVIDAPRDLVFSAWTDREQIGQWWGPDGFTTTTFEMDVRPGGVWRYVMHGPDGTDYENRIVYTEVDPPARLVYDHGDFETIQFSTTVAFVEQDGKTTVKMTALWPTKEMRDQMVNDFGVVDGGNQTLTRLAHYLASSR